MYKENASLFNDYANIIEIKEKEKKYINEDRNKIIQDMNSRLFDMEEQKLKSEFKVDVLERDNKNIFNDLINEIKKK